MQIVFHSTSTNQSFLFFILVTKVEEVFFFPLKTCRALRDKALLMSETGELQPITASFLVFF